jgi:hypothetical protein
MWEMWNKLDDARKYQVNPIGVGTAYQHISNLGDNNLFRQRFSNIGSFKLSIFNLGLFVSMGEA